MKAPIRRIERPVDDPSCYLTREWLVTNGQGGYASGTIAGILTRRYHGLLVAALPAPTGRIVMLSAIDAQIRIDHEHVIGLEPQPSPIDAEPALEHDRRPSLALSEFRLEAG